MLPKQLGCGSGMTCWRRLRDWQHAGIWDLTHFVLLNWLSRNGQIDWSHAVVDSCSVRAVFGGRKLGRIRPIELNGAASAVWSVTGVAFRRCKACVVGPDLVPIAYWEIGPTTQRKSAGLCVHVTSRNAQYGKWQRFGTMALGHRTYLRVVEPVPSSSPAV